jgi:16S rRNA (cytidine1402-2'-O)-methyltransferase
MRGGLILCGTPIGNLEDVTFRLLRVLAEADVVACEDTRRTRKLLTHHGVTVRDLVSYNEQNERRQGEALLRRMRLGQTVALVSDAGMPGLSDPGYRLVRSCADAGIEVSVLPGPTAAVSALAVSGLPPARFVFEGFLPRKSGERRRRLEELKSETRTIVVYESPHRIEATVADMAEVWGERPAVLARELTKMHEEVRRAPLNELLAGVRADPPRGEIVLVVSGAIHGAQELPSATELAARARALMDEGLARKDALSKVAHETGAPRRAVFDALIEREEPEA